MIQKHIKKVFDFLIATIGIVVLFPLLILIFFLIKIDSKGSALFKQERFGKNGKLFKVWKFRTMVSGADQKTQSKVLFKDDENITRVGKFLREWTLDEWPQLVNVIRGEMSLVGPRPLPKYQNQELDEMQKKRLRVLPGMVSIVDIKGRNLVPWEKRFELDNWYIDNWSLRLDLKILLLTPLVVLSRKGVYGEGGKNPIPKK